MRVSTTKIRAAARLPMAGTRVMKTRNTPLALSDGWALPTSGYGIKVVAPLFGFAWQAADAGGLASEAWYAEWLERGDDPVLVFDRVDLARVPPETHGRLREIGRAGKYRVVEVDRPRTHRPGLP